MLISLAMLMTASLSTNPDQTAVDGVQEAKPAAAVSFARRPRARILSSQDVRNFQVRREDHFDTVVYLETARNTWFRGEMICRGLGDPRDADSVQPISHTMGIDDNTTLIFRAFSSETSVCRMTSLVRLTPDEALDLKLVRPAKAKKG